MPCTELECKACQFSIPFCIVTGMHVVADDYTVCPSCRFDATHSAFVARPAQLILTILDDQSPCATNSRVNCVPEHIKPNRDPSTGWRCRSVGAGGAS